MAEPKQKIKEKKKEKPKLRGEAPWSVAALAWPNLESWIVPLLVFLRPLNRCWEAAYFLFSIHESFGDFPKCPWWVMCLLCVWVKAKTWSMQVGALWTFNCCPRSSRYYPRCVQEAAHVFGVCPFTKEEGGAFYGNLNVHGIKWETCDLEIWLP